MSGPAAQGQQVATVPSIYIKVIKAEGIRQHKGRVPTPSMLIRVSVAGQAQPEVLKTKPMPAGSDPLWNQEFTLPVPDPTAAQLECTIWDEEDQQAQGYSNFLGEVLLNLARLAPYKGHYIEQLFYIKQGKTIVTEEQASGNLKLGLRLDIPDNVVPPAATPTAAPPAATPAAAQQHQEEEQRRQQEQERRNAEQAAAAAAQKRAQEEQAASEAQRRHHEAEMARRQAEEQAEMQRGAEQEKMRQQELARSVIGSQELARMQAQEEEMAKQAAQRAPPPPASPTLVRASPPPTSPPSSQPASGQAASPERTQARIVIAVIEAHELPANVNAQAKIVLQGPVSLSAAQTRALKDSNEPFWNEKFVFEVEEMHMSQTCLCAEIVNAQDENNAQRLGSIQPIPVTALLSGQKMSLPTVNQGNYIYCIDGWFEVSAEAHGGQSATTGSMTPTKSPGKSQMHLRMTFIPAPDAPPPQFPEAPRMAIIPPVGAEAPRPATPPAVPVAPPSPVPVAPPSPVPVAPLSSPSVAPRSPLPAPPSAAAPVPSPLPSVPPPPADVPQEPRVLAHQEFSRRAPRERTPLPVKGGPADVGIVLDVNKVDGSLVVSELVPGGPAMEGGQIRTGDVLIDVDGYDVVGRPVDDAQSLLAGQPNSPVTMILQRGGKAGEPLVVTLLRAVPGGNPPFSVAAPTRAAPPVAPPHTPARAASPPLPEPVAHVPMAPPQHAPVSTAAPGEMEKALSIEFKNISYLWSGGQRDPVHAALVDWKDDLLYGGPLKPSAGGSEEPGRIWGDRYPPVTLAGSFSAATYGPGLRASYGAYNHHSR